MDSAAPAQRDFCAEIREIVVDARRTPSFALLPRYPESRPMLGFTTCLLRDAAAIRFECLRPHIAEGDRGWTSADDLLSRIAQCLPEAIRSGPETRYVDGRSSGQLVPEDQQEFPPGDFRNNLRHHRRSLYLDSGPLRFEHRLLLHPRIPSRQTLVVYLRDADESETRPAR